MKLKVRPMNDAHRKRLEDLSVVGSHGRMFTGGFKVPVIIDDVRQVRRRLKLYGEFEMVELTECRVFPLVGVGSAWINCLSIDLDDERRS